MLEFQSIELKNVAVFSQARLRISDSGLTLVSGFNNDAVADEIDEVDDTVSSTYPSNASGKSLLFASIANLLFDSPPLSNKRVGRKDMLSTSTSSIALNLLGYDGSTYTFIQGSKKYTIIKNGEDLKVRTIDRAKQIIEEVCPLTSNDFYSMVYLSTQRTIPFLYETDVKRSEILTDLFRFGIYDALKDHFSVKLKETKKTSEKLNDLRDEIQEVKTKLKDLKWEKSQQDRLSKMERMVNKGSYQKASHQCFELKTYLLSLQDLYFRLQEDKKALATIRIEQSTLIKNNKLFGSMDDVVLSGLIERELSLRDIIEQNKAELVDFASREKDYIDRFNDEVNSTLKWLKEKQRSLQESGSSLKLSERSWFTVTDYLYKLELVLDELLNSPLTAPLVFTRSNKSLKWKDADAYMEILAKIPSVTDLIYDIKQSLKTFNKVAAFGEEYEKAAKSVCSYVDSYLIKDPDNRPCSTLSESYLNFCGGIESLTSKNLTSIDKAYEIKVLVSRLCIDLNEIKGLRSLYKQTSALVNTVSDVKSCPVCGSQVTISDLYHHAKSNQYDMAVMDFFIGLGEELLAADDALADYMKSVSQINEVKRIPVKSHWKNNKNVFIDSMSYVKGLRVLYEDYDSKVTIIKNLVSSLSGLTPPSKLTLDSDRPLLELKTSVLVRLAKLIKDKQKIIGDIDRTKLAIREQRFTFIEKLQRTPLVVMPSDKKESLDLLLQDLSYGVSSVDKPPTSLNFTEHLTYLEDRKQQLSLKMKNLFNEVVKLKNRKNSYDLYNSKLTDLQWQEKELNQQVLDLPILNSLVQAYSPKGLRNIALNNVATLFQTNLNTFASLLYGESIKFCIQAQDAGISAKVERENGTASDIRLLSGSESDSFSLLYLLTVLSLMPVSRRTNFVVLDEMDSHMDEISRGRFYTTYLSTLKTVVPNIFVITPRTLDTEVPLTSFSRLVRVEKTDGKSRVLVKKL